MKAIEKTCKRAVIKIIYFPNFSYPLLNIPLPGTIPTKVVVPYTIASTESSDPAAKGFTQPQHENVVPSIFNINNLTFEQPFPWASNDPLIYIQQIVLRTSVVPWKKELLLTDAYRGPLHEIFKLLEIVRNHEDENR